MSQRILTTHTGSLPRPRDLVPMLVARESGGAPDAALDARIRSAVAEVVERQIQVGIDLVNDGEAGKFSYASYPKDRLTGFGPGVVAPPHRPEAEDFPGYFARTGGSAEPRPGPVCVGPVARKPEAEVEVARDIANLRAALAGCSPAGAFLSAASPGVISLFLPNRYYPSHEAYVWSLAEAMKPEYDAIAAAGFLVQVDCPDLASSRVSRFPDLDFSSWRRIAEIHVEALNWALRDIPPEHLRLHVCWGNYEGPHHRDVPLREIVDIILRVRPAAISFEAANPRHAHEWKLWREIRLPEDKVLMPGVIDSTTNYLEHPELVADRIEAFASVVGRDRVIAGVDCGLATGATSMLVDPDIAWAKLAALAEGAAIATERLWDR